MQIKVRNGNVESAIKVFKKKCAEKLWDFRKAEYYQKPSTARKTAHKAAVKREQKRISNEQ